MYCLILDVLLVGGVSLAIPALLLVAVGLNQHPSRAPGGPLRQLDSRFGALSLGPHCSKYCYSISQYHTFL